MSLQAVRERGGGLVCLTGCANHGVHDEPTARRRWDAFGPHRRPARGVATPLRPPRSRPQPGAREARPASWGGVRGERGRARSRARSARSCRTPSWRCATAPRSTPASRCGGVTTATCWASPRRWRPASPSTPRRCAKACAWPKKELRSDLRRDLGYRYPGIGGPGRGCAASRSCVVCGWRSALGTRAPAHGRGSGGGRGDGGRVPRQVGAGWALRRCVRNEAVARLEEELQ